MLKMASLSNICRMNLYCNLLRRKGVSCRFIATTGKKKDTKKECPSSEDIYRKIPDFSKPLENKNWVSYGFDFENKFLDRYEMHLFGFTFITLMFCGLVFIYAYYPDKDLNDWARREAFIRLNEREQLGLEPIDPNYIDPSKMTLPPDEELTDDDIII